jgi:hypothetical protein
MPVRVVEGIYHLMLFGLELEVTWGRGRIVLMSYFHRPGEDGGVKQSIRLGERRILPDMLIIAVFANGSLTLSIKS